MRSVPACLLTGILGFCLGIVLAPRAAPPTPADSGARGDVAADRSSSPRPSDADPAGNDRNATGPGAQGVPTPATSEPPPPQTPAAPMGDDPSSPPAPAAAPPPPDAPPGIPEAIAAERERALDLLGQMQVYLPIPMYVDGELNSQIIQKLELSPNQATALGDLLRQCDTQIEDLQRRNAFPPGTFGPMTITGYAPFPEQAAAIRESFLHDLSGLLTTRQIERLRPIAAAHFLRHGRIEIRRTAPDGTPGDLVSQTSYYE